MSRGRNNRGKSPSSRTSYVVLSRTFSTKAITIWKSAVQSDLTLHAFLFLSPQSATNLCIMAPKGLFLVTPAFSILVI